jgi:autotransporter translocation and assembly factor TamB
VRRALAALVLLLLLAVAPVYFFFTEHAARVLLGEAARRADLQLDYAGGTLAGGLRLRSFSLQRGDFALAASELAVVPHWSPGCLLRSTLCLEVLRAGRLSLTLPPGADDSGDDWALPRGLRLPLRVSVDDLRLGEVAIRRGDVARSLRNLSAAVRLRRSGVSLQRLALSTDEGDLAGSLRVAWRDAWPVAADLLLVPADGVVPAGYPQQWRLQLDGDLRDFAVALRSEAEGAVSASGRLRLPADALLRAELTLQGAQQLPVVAGLAPWVVPEQPVQLQVAVKADTQTVTLQSALGGWSEAPLALSSTLQRVDGELTLQALTLEDRSGTRRLEAAGPLTRAGELRPRLQFSARQLALPAALDIPLRIEEGAGRLALDPSAPSFGWALEELSARLVYDQHVVALSGNLRAAPDHALLALGEVDGSVDGRRLRYRRDGAGAAARVVLPEGLVAGTFSLDAIEAELTPGDIAVLEIALSGDARGELQLSLQQRDYGASLNLAPFRLRLREEIVHSNETISARWLREQAALAVDPWCLQLRGLSLCTEEESMLGTRGALRVLLAGEERLTNDFGENPYSIFVQGRGELRVAWNEAGLDNATLDLALSQLNIDPFLGAGSAPPVGWENVQVRARATTQSQQLSVAAESSRLGSLQLEVQRRADDAIDGDLRLDALALAALDDLLPEIDMTAGRLWGELALSGTVAAPRFAGSLRLDEGRAVLASQGLAVEDLALRLDGDNDAFRLTGSAVLGDGPLELNGVCCEDDALQLRVLGERNRLRLPVGLDALVTPDFRLSVSSEQARLSGAVRVHEGVLEHRGVSAEGVSPSRDVVRIDEPPPSPRRFRVDTDVRAIIEPGFTLRSTQLEATLGGDLRFSAGSERPPQLFGELQVLGGVLRAYGQALRLDRGSVGFVGDPLNPDLALSAVRDIRSEQLQVGVRVVGTLDAPQLSLFSDPQRSERETLSYLLRGRPPDAGAGADGTAMALSLGASAINQSGLLESLNALPGLSQVSIGAEGQDEETAATISAYVGERLFLSYGMGIYEPVNALTARLYLRSRLWLEVVSRLESSFDLYYRFDID